MAIPDTPLTKTALRKRMRQALREQHPDPTAVCSALNRWLVERPAPRTLAVYAPLPGEADLSAVVRAHPDRRWVYPKVRGHLLTFHAVKDPAAELFPGAFGILEPAGDSPEAGIMEIDAFICPGLAFDQNGGRLGRGRGFYDRMLALARPGALKIGICFGSQLVPDTFAEPHDIPMDEVIS